MSKTCEYKTFTATEEQRAALMRRRLFEGSKELTPTDWYTVCGLPAIGEVLGEQLCATHYDIAMAAELEALEGPHAAMYQELKDKIARNDPPDKA